jgi:Domain of unknown function (DUF1707)/Cell wall-active antibiotics response 4TMS YvqF
MTVQPPEPSPPPEVTRPATPPTPGDASQLRISDAERHQVSEMLRDAAGDGRLTIDELDERIEAVYAAKTYADLVPVTVDLPGAAAILPKAAFTPAASSAARVQPLGPGSSHSASGSVAIFGGATRKGPWTVAEQYTALAVFGGVELDFRDVTFTAAETTVYANCLFGGIEITVPDDVVVHVSGIPIFGGYDHGNGGPDTYPPNAPVMHVKGLAIFGGVEVKRKPRKPKAVEDKS